MILSGKANRKLKLWLDDIYNAFHLDDERDRITDILQNNGYYYFNRDFVFFEVDSAGGNHEMNLKVKIKPNLVASTDEPWKIISLPHLRYFIRDIYIRPNFDPLAPPDIHSDTLLYNWPGKTGQKPPGDYYILYQKDDHIHPRTVIQSVFIKPGDPFRLTDISKTRSRVAELGVFGYSNIRFKPVPCTDSA